MSGAKERASLGFGRELEEFDPDSWRVPDEEGVAERRRFAVSREAAEAAGFRSREPGQATASPPPVRQRRRRTGRNTQFNIKTKPETVEAFCAIADAKGWGLGETFEFATDLLTRELGKDDPGLDEK